MVEIVACTKLFKGHNSVLICPSLNNNIAILVENFNAAVWNKFTSGNIGFCNFHAAFFWLIYKAFSDLCVAYLDCFTVIFNAERIDIFIDNKAVRSDSFF